MGNVVFQEVSTTGNSIVPVHFEEVFFPRGTEGKTEPDSQPLHTDSLDSA